MIYHNQIKEVYKQRIKLAGGGQAMLRAEHVIISV
jgi:hypothetical protein